MSLFVTLIAIFMAWLGASTIIELLHFGHWFQLIPSWLGWVFVVAIAAWLGGK
jgi:hypothetical protein